MEKNEQSGIPDPESTDVTGRRNIEMEKNELSRIPDPDVVVSPDDKVKFKGRNNNDLESSSSKQEKHQPKYTKIVEDNPKDPVVSTDYVKKKKVFGCFTSQGEFPQVKFKGRNNNDLESSSSKHEKDQPKYTKIEIEELEKILEAHLDDIHEPVSQCCIYKVPKDLRRINREAYTPQVISIGPFYHGKPWLSEMENQKLIYMLEFLKREGPEKLEEFKKFIQDNEKHIRNRYWENSRPKDLEFKRMILCDAVFIIELFFHNVVEKRDSDFFLDKPNARAAITRDLQLLENQLPYFLLKKLFEKGAFHDFPEKLKNKYPDDLFLILSHQFFFPEDGVIPKPKIEIQHFTDLIRHFLSIDFLQQDQKKRNFLLMDSRQQNQKKRNFLLTDLPTATKLHGSGVKFKKGTEGGSSLKISCEFVTRAMRIPGVNSCGELRIPCSKELMLRIPPLKIDGRTECLYRNLMALEQCHYPYETHICNFILLMNFLINTKKDVDFLVDQKIINSSLGDNAAVVKMFNSLSLQITASTSVYYNLGEDLKSYYNSHRRVRRWNRNMATLKTVYFRDIWTGTATVAAFILLVLTFIQAVCSILPLL